LLTAEFKDHLCLIFIQIISPAGFHLFYMCINTRILPLIEAIVAEDTGQSMPENKIRNINSTLLHIHPSHIVNIYFDASKRGNIIDFYGFCMKQKMNSIYKTIK